ncbi:hypothetical protein EVAR_82311_1 [Eumeta japonica]|uniref:Uncharacterized protein n=1 Tax=Eumeta variegata TaxID=151549 RepID=A0A4C1VXX5_EUMVA|nr:hypothetical protein EVAR_82311_1 [Eumeta japonica]
MKYPIPKRYSVVGMSDRPPGQVWAHQFNDPPRRISEVINCAFYAVAAARPQRPLSADAAAVVAVDTRFIITPRGLVNVELYRINHFIYHFLQPARRWRKNYLVVGIQEAFDRQLIHPKLTLILFRITQIAINEQRPGAAVPEDARSSNGSRQWPQLTINLAGFVRADTKAL